jgi:hypothetical protein
MLNLLGTVVRDALAATTEFGAITLFIVWSLVWTPVALVLLSIFLVVVHGFVHLSARTFSLVSALWSQLIELLS